MVVGKVKLVRSVANKNIERRDVGKHKGGVIETRHSLRPHKPCSTSDEAIHFTEEEEEYRDEGNDSFKDVSVGGRTNNDDDFEDVQVQKNDEDKALGKKEEEGKVNNAERRIPNTEHKVISARVCTCT
ncbi:unnamed protein product [Cuscuta europaea]|uniref:Uncharacterized protein n=1 Tax=Cuscuta europaea TaxID=41803 RepID=A0A9P1EDF5_CUSEU|nr:unnamed protein product [Cuscuta europaea]